MLQQINTFGFYKDNFRVVLMRTACISNSKGYNIRDCIIPVSILHIIIWSSELRSWPELRWKATWFQHSHQIHNPSLCWSLKLPLLMLIDWEPTFYNALTSTAPPGNRKEGLLQIYQKSHWGRELETVESLVASVVKRRKQKGSCWERESCGIYLYIEIQVKTCL